MVSENVNHTWKFFCIYANNNTMILALLLLLCFLTPIRSLLNFLPLLGAIDCQLLVSGITTYSQRTHYYTLHVPINQSTLVISTCGSSFNTYLSVYDYSGSLYASCDDCGNCGVQTVLALLSFPAGDYYVAINGSNLAYGNYDLRLLGFFTTKKNVGNK